MFRLQGILTTMLHGVNARGMSLPVVLAGDPKRLINSIEIECRVADGY